MVGKTDARCNNPVYITLSTIKPTISLASLEERKMVSDNNILATYNYNNRFLSLPSCSLSPICHISPDIETELIS